MERSLKKKSGLQRDEALIFFFFRLLSNCLNWKIYCDDHSPLSTLENETLFDRAVNGYADRLQEQFFGIPQIQVRKYLNLTSQPCLPMGWALKTSHVRRTTFTEKQKDYLTSKFRIEETTGQNANAASVATSVMTARDSNGNRLFTSSEFLTPQ